MSSKGPATPAVRFTPVTIKPESNACGGLAASRAIHDFGNQRMAGNRPMKRNSAGLDGVSAISEIITPAASDPTAYSPTIRQLTCWRCRTARQPLATSCSSPCVTKAADTGSTKANPPIRTRPPAMPKMPERVAVRNANIATKRATKVLMGSSSGRAARGGHRPPPVAIERPYCGRAL